MKTGLCLGVIVTGALVTTSCSSLTVPVVPPTFRSEDFLREQGYGLTIFAYPIEGPEAYWQLFEEDLPRLGIGAVWVKIENNGNGPVDLEAMDFRMRLGREDSRELSAGAVLKRFYKGRNIRMYTLKAHDKSLRALSALVIDRTTLPPGDTVEGFIFLRINPTEDKRWTPGALLLAQDIRLPNREKIRIEVPLSHADR